MRLQQTNAVTCEESECGCKRCSWWYVRRADRFERVPLRPSGACVLPPAGRASALLRPSARMASPRGELAGRCKLVVRRLPPTLTQAAFVSELASKLGVSSGSDGLATRVAWLRYVPGRAGPKRAATSLAYVAAHTEDAVPELAAALSALHFLSDKGVPYKAAVEYAPSQRTPKQGKRDPREDTLEQEPLYTAFLEALAAGKEGTVTGQSAPEPAPKAKDEGDTPLLAFVRARSEARQKQRAAAAAGRAAGKAARAEGGAAKGAAPQAKPGRPGRAAKAAPGAQGAPAGTTAVAPPKRGPPKAHGRPPPPPPAPSAAPAGPPPPPPAPVAAPNYNRIPPPPPMATLPLPLPPVAAAPPRILPRPAVPVPHMSHLPPPPPPPPARAALPVLPDVESFYEATPAMPLPPVGQQNNNFITFHAEGGPGRGAGRGHRGRGRGGHGRGRGRSGG